MELWHDRLGSGLRDPKTREGTWRNRMGRTLTCAKGEGSPELCEKRANIDLTSAPSMLLTVSDKLEVD